MPSKEEIIRKILQFRPDLTKENVEETIRSKRRDAGKLLTDEGAAYMVANDLGIDLSSEKVLQTQITIKDLAVGVSDATINGEVTAVNQVKSFHRSDGREGKVARIALADETGTLNVVLWDENAEIAESKLKRGDFVRVNHGYVKAGLDGRPELNVGQKGSVVVLPQNLTQNLRTTETAPTVSPERLQKIRELGENSYVEVVAFVKEVSVTKTFSRSDGREGRVARVRVVDETGRIVVVFWDEKTDLVSGFHEEDCIKIVSGQVRRGLSGALEIHVGNRSEVQVLQDKPERMNLPLLPLTKLGKLSPGMNDVDVLARVASVGAVKEFARPSGDSGRVGEVFLMDETGSVRLSLWDEKTDMLGRISSGDVVLIEGAYTREGYGGISLNLGKMGTLKVNPDIDEAKQLPVNPTGIIKISELRAGFSASIRGSIVEEPEVKTVSTRDGREIRVASLSIRDESGEIRGSFWGDFADRLESVSPGSEVTVRNAYVKNGFSGELEISSRSTTQIEMSKARKKTGKVTEQPKQETVQKIAELREGERARIQGKVLDITKSRLYMACPQCRSKVTEEDGEWECKKCGTVTQPIPRLLINVLVEDDSGEISALIGGDLAERLLGMKAEYAWNVATQSGDGSTPVDMVKNRIINQSITLVGRAKTDNFGELSFTVDSTE